LGISTKLIVDEEAPRLLASVMHFLTAELLEIAGEKVLDNVLGTKRKMITA